MCLQFSFASLFLGCRFCFEENIHASHRRSWSGTVSAHLNQSRRDINGNGSCPHVVKANKFMRCPNLQITGVPMPLVRIELGKNVVSECLMCDQQKAETYLHIHAHRAYLSSSRPMRTKAFSLKKALASSDLESSPLYTLKYTSSFSFSILQQAINSGISKVSFMHSSFSYILL